MTTSVDAAALRERTQQVWDAGSYEPLVERYLGELHERFLAALDARTGEKILDVATGTGAIALGAARAGAVVTGIDIAPSLLETARRKAAAAGLQVRFDHGDAAQLPYEDASFDTVCSCIGAMFAPQHAPVARELARVCAPRGRLLLCSWANKGGVAAQFETMRPFQPPPPPGVESPFAWGDPSHVTELLGDAFELEFEEDEMGMAASSARELVEMMNDHYGPQKLLRASLDEERRAELDRAMEDHWNSFRTADGINRPSPYLLVRGTRRS